MSIRVRMSQIGCKITTFPRIGKTFLQLFSLNIINLDSFPANPHRRTIPASVNRKLEKRKGYKLREPVALCV